MDDRMMIIGGLKTIQSYFESKANMTIGNGKMLLLNWANVVRDAGEMLREKEPVKAVVSNTPGITWWYQCGYCNTSVNYRDKYCSHCGREIVFE